MDTGKKPKAAPAPEPYGPEVLCAGWNPEAAGTGRTSRESYRKWLADVDAETFLRQFYRSQSI